MGFGLICRPGLRLFGSRSSGCVGGVLCAPLPSRPPPLQVGGCWVPLAAKNGLPLRYGVRCPISF